MKTIRSLWRGLCGLRARSFYYDAERRAYLRQRESVSTDPRCRGIR